MVSSIVAAVGAESILFQAPGKSQQAWFVRHFGANANVASMTPEDVLSLETLRLGLRSETLLHFR